MVDITRALVPLDSQSEEAVQTAFGYANAICEKTGSGEIILLTHTKHQLDHTSLSRMLGAHLVRSLSKGPVAIAPGIRLRAETMRTQRWPTSKSVLLVYYAERDILDLADGTRDVVGIVAVPDLPGQADDWAARWGAIIHGEERKKPAQLIEDIVVVRALEALTGRVNLSTGIGHPRDKETANETLRILRAKGHDDPTPNIRSWAITHGWKPEQAAKLETMSRKIWDLKNKPSLGSFYNPHERYDRWRTGWE